MSVKSDILSLVTEITQISGTALKLIFFYCYYYDKIVFKNNSIKKVFPLK